MMARTRCWNFDDDGKPWRQCRPNCSFVHPDSIQWATAERKGNPRDNARKGSSDYSQKRDTGWGKRTSHWDNPSSGNWSGNWSGQTASASTSSSQTISTNAEPKFTFEPSGASSASSKTFSFDAYVWDAPASSADQTSAPSDSTWGGTSGSTWGNASSSAWGDKPESTRGNAPKSAWGCASGPPWEDQAGRNQSTPSSSTYAWGTTPSSSTTIASAWGTVDSSSSVRGKEGREEGVIDKASASQWQDVDQRDKGKGRGDPSPPTDSHPPPPELPRPSPPPPMTPSLSGEKKGPTIKVPGGRFQLSKAANAEVPPDPLSKDGTDLTKATAEPMPVPEVSAAKKYRGPEGRIQLFLDTQKHIQEAVFYRMQYRRAKNNLLHFNQLQHSKMFAFPSADAKIQLELEFDKAKKQVNTAKEQFENELQLLLQLPSITSESEGLRDPKTTEKHFRNYVFEVEKWMHDIQAEIIQKMSPVALEEDGSSQEPTMAHLLIGNKNYTWEELKNVVTDLESRVDTIYDLYEGLTSSQEVAEYFGRLPERALPDISDLLKRELAEVLPASALVPYDQRAGALNGQLDVQAERMKNTFIEVAALREETEQLNRETYEINAVCDRAERRIEEMVQEDVVATAKLAKLTEELKHLHTDELERRRLKMEAEHAAVDEQILEAIRPIVLEHIKQKMDPIFTSLRVRCDEAQEELAEYIKEIVEPMVRLADDICRWILLNQQEGSSAPPPILATG